MIRFFLIPYYVPDNYSPEAIALAEGFRALGIPYSSNINYWYEPEQRSFLFEERETSDYQIAIYDYKYLYHSRKWTLGRVDESKFNILLDRNDWLSHEWSDPRVLERFDLILVDHYLAGFDYPSKVRPWAIGITQRIINYTNRFAEDPSCEQKNRIASNFRVAHNLRGLLKPGLDQALSQRYQIVDKILDRSVDSSADEEEADESYWRQSAGRHNSGYYKLLNECLMTYAFGGYYEYRPFLTQPYSIVDKIRRRPFIWYSKLLRKRKRDASPAHFVFQFDSFRFWEALYSSTCPIHLDLEAWGLRCPEQPVSGKHYLGISGFDTQGFSERVLKMDAEEIAEIGRMGREWCYENYRPEAVAKRLLRWAGQG